MSAEDFRHLFQFACKEYDDIKEEWFDWTEGKQLDDPDENITHTEFLTFLIMTGRYNLEDDERI